MFLKNTVTFIFNIFKTNIVWMSFLNFFVIYYLQKPCFFINEDYNKYYITKKFKKIILRNFSFKNNQHKSNSIFWKQNYDFFKLEFFIKIQNISEVTSPLIHGGQWTATLKPNYF